MTALFMMMTIVCATMLAVVLSATSAAARKCGTGGAMYNAPVYVWGGSGSPLLAELERGLRSEGGDVPCMLSRLSNGGVPFVAVAASSANVDAAAIAAEVGAARAASQVSFGRFLSFFPFILLPLHITFAWLVLGRSVPLYPCASSIYILLTPALSTP